jgi:drug/metabolite transporter (DMT)-like permease
MVAFAANSLLCRMALGGHLVDPVSFATIRLVGGAVALLPLARVIPEPRSRPAGEGSWRSAAALFAYALPFALAYVSLSTGMGALILFGAVQVTMMAAALSSGERLRPAQWFGFAMALGGLLYLLLPGVAAPDPLGALLMGMAGIAWGLYSIAGRGAVAPVALTAGNFLRTVPMALVASALWISRLHATPRGVMLALVSGVVTSGLGYVLWYKTLPRLTRTQASIVQLVVPVIAALGGVAFLSERVTTRLLIASALILGGVALAVVRTAGVPRSAPGSPVR